MGTTLSLPIMSLVTSPEITWYRRTLDFYVIRRAFGSTQHQIILTSCFWSILHLFQQFGITGQCLYQLGRKLKVNISFFPHSTLNFKWWKKSAQTVSGKCKNATVPLWLCHKATVRSGGQCKQAVGEILRGNTSKQQKQPNKQQFYSWG